jgi:hypothetical protein
VPIDLHNNLVDAAIAEGEFHDLDRKISWSGYARGWRRRNNVINMVGQVVKKTGRTTNFTTGRITVVNATRCELRGRPSRSLQRTKSSRLRCRLVAIPVL